MEDEGRKRVGSGTIRERPKGTGEITWLERVWLWHSTVFQCLLLPPLPLLALGACSLQISSTHTLSVVCVSAFSDIVLSKQHSGRSKEAEPPPPAKTSIGIDLIQACLQNTHIICLRRRMTL